MLHSSMLYLDGGLNIRCPALSTSRTTGVLSRYRRNPCLTELVTYGKRLRKANIRELTRTTDFPGQSSSTSVTKWPDNSRTLSHPFLLFHVNPYIVLRVFVARLLLLSGYLYRFPSPGTLPFGGPVMDPTQTWINTLNDMADLVHRIGDTSDSMFDLRGTLGANLRALASWIERDGAPPRITPETVREISRLLAAAR